LQRGKAYIQEYIDTLRKWGAREEAEELLFQFLDRLYPEDENIDNIRTIKEFGTRLPFIKKFTAIYAKKNDLSALTTLILTLTPYYMEQKDGSIIKETYPCIRNKLPYFDAFFELAESCKNDNTETSARIYYDLSTAAFFNYDLEKVSNCLKALENLNSNSSFSLDEQQWLRTRQYIVQQANAINKLQKEVEHLRRSQYQLRSGDSTVALSRTPRNQENLDTSRSTTPLSRSRTESTPSRRELSLKTNKTFATQAEGTPPLNPPIAPSWMQAKGGKEVQNQEEKSKSLNDEFEQMLGELENMGL
jgi:hypothetical protein